MEGEVCLGWGMSDHKAASVSRPFKGAFTLQALEGLPWDAQAGAMCAGTALGSVVSLHMG